MFQKTRINKHSTLGNNINYSFIFNLVLEVALLLSHDQMDHIHNDVHFLSNTNHFWPPKPHINQYDMWIIKNNQVQICYKELHVPL